MSCGSDVSGQQGGIATRMVAGDPTTGEREPQQQVLEADLLTRLREVTLGEYEILAELGRGGMATVYLAHDIQLDRKVAIKVLSPGVAQGEGMVERFRLEARTAASLSHPHIIPIFAVRETESIAYFVMKFVVGRPLDTIIKQLAPLPVPAARTILTKVAEALGYAHRNGVIHRDIKPANIMIDAEGMPIVTDFGIAKVADRERLTLTGAAIGTPTYMSPEQCNASTITGASDQYSLGVMAYEMLTGKTLYQGDSVVTIMFKHCHEPPPTPEAFGPEVPADLASTVIRMLQKAPQDRWTTMEDALPGLRGADAGHDDAVRTQMMEYAKGGTHVELLARLSTPRSPLFVSARTPGVQPSAAPVPSAEPGLRSGGGKWRGMLAGGAVLVLLAAVALAVWRPWQTQATPTAAVVPSAGAAPALPAEVPDSAAVPARPETAAVPAAAERSPEPTPVAGRPSPAVVGAVRIDGAPAALSSGESAALRATVLDQQGRPMAGGVRWSSSDQGVASVDQSGQLRAGAPGQATITAQAAGRQARVQVAVTSVVASVAVEPGAAELTPGAAAAFTAVARRQDGSPVSGAVATWRSSDEGVAVVASSGRVTAVGGGSAVISAIVDGQAGTARVTVTAPRAAAPPPAVAATAAQENPQEAVAAVIAAYARALEAKDLAAVRSLYPGMTPALERRTRDALDAMDDLQVRLAPAEVRVSGSTAQVQVTGAWTYAGGRLDVNNRYTLERRDAGWVIVTID